MPRYIDADAMLMHLDVLEKHAQRGGLYNQAHMYKRFKGVIKDAIAYNVAPKTETATEFAELVKGVVEFDISISDSETEYLLFRIDEVLKEYLEGKT